MPRRSAGEGTYVLAGALRAVAKRFEQIADKIDIDEPPQMISPVDPCGR
jgi:hypothetical protein